MNLSELKGAIPQMAGVLDELLRCQWGDPDRGVTAPGDVDHCEAQAVRMVALHFSSDGEDYQLPLVQHSVHFWKLCERHAQRFEAETTPHEDPA